MTAAVLTLLRYSQDNIKVIASSEYFTSPHVSILAPTAADAQNRSCRNNKPCSVHWTQHTSSATAAASLSAVAGPPAIHFQKLDTSCAEARHRSPTAYVQAATAAVAHLVEM
jgi:hypothetical protein